MPVLGGIAATSETFMTVGTQVVSAVFTPADPTADNGSTGTVSVIVVPPFSVGETLTVINPPAGAFTVSAPTTSTITMTVSGNTATGTMNPITIIDTRNTYPGWSVVGQASDFTNPTADPPGVISGNQLGWVPTSTSLHDHRLSVLRDTVQSSRALSGSSAHSLTPWGWADRSAPLGTV